MPLLLKIVSNGGDSHLVVVLDELPVDPAPGQPLLRGDPVFPFLQYLVDAERHFVYDRP